MSSEAAGLDVDLDEVLNAKQLRTIDAGTELVAFAEAVAAATDHADVAVAEARLALAELVGETGVKEAAATIAIFNGLVRAADATGIELDAGVVADSSDFRAELGLDDYNGAANTSARSIEAPAQTPTTDIASLFGG